LPHSSWEPLRIISDDAIGEGNAQKLDQLGFLNYANVLGRVIRGTQGSLTVGVFGEWGTGKTSLLRLIESQLSEDPLNTRTIWFNAWRYEREVHPLLPLIQLIIHSLDNGSGKEFLGAASLGIIEGLRSALRCIVASTKLSLAPLGVGVELSGEHAREELERQQKNMAEIAQPYTGAFRELDAIELPAGKRIVVLIDDLDRCMPQNALSVLESVKLAMSRPGFVFVVAVSPRILHDYLRHKYSAEYGVVTFTGAEYLEKIVQLPFYIPDNSGRMKRFSESLLEVLDENERNQFKPILPLIEQVCGSVPRAAIRFFNSILLTSAIRESVGVENSNVPLAAFAIDRLLQLRWPDVYSMLVTDEDAIAALMKAADSGGFVGQEPPEGVSDTLFSSIQGDQTLKRLLFSGTGREWLVSTQVSLAIPFLCR